MVIGPQGIISYCVMIRDLPTVTRVYLRSRSIYSGMQTELFFSFFFLSSFRQSFHEDGRGDVGLKISFWLMRSRPPPPSPYIHHNTYQHCFDVSSDCSSTTWLIANSSYINSEFTSSVCLSACLLSVCLCLCLCLCLSQSLSLSQSRSACPSVSPSPSLSFLLPPFPLIIFVFTFGDFFSSFLYGLFAFLSFLLLFVHGL